MGNAPLNPLHSIPLLRFQSNFNQLEIDCILNEIGQAQNHHRLTDYPSIPIEYAW